MEVLQWLLLMWVFLCSSSDSSSESSSDTSDSSSSDAKHKSKKGAIFVFCVQHC